MPSHVAGGANSTRIVLLLDIAADAGHAFEVAQFIRDRLYAAGAANVWHFKCLGCHDSSLVSDAYIVTNPYRHAKQIECIILASNCLQESWVYRDKEASALSAAFVTFKLGLFAQPNLCNQLF